MDLYAKWIPSKKLEYLKEVDCEILGEKIDELQKMTFVLINKLL